MSSSKGKKGLSKPYDKYYNPSGHPINTKKSRVDGYFKKFIKRGKGR